VSYLNPLRLHFSGSFEAAVSTVNNDPVHYDSARFKPSDARTWTGTAPDELRIRTTLIALGEGAFTGLHGVQLHVHQPAEGAARRVQRHTARAQVGLRPDGLPAAAGRRHDGGHRHGGRPGRA
jgi:hypothetical protein